MIKNALIVMYESIFDHLHVTSTGEKVWQMITVQNVTKSANTLVRYTVIHKLNF